jgi:hypothetical protein
MYARKLAVWYLDKQIPDPQIIAKYLNKPAYTISMYRNNFEKQLRADKTLRYLKKQCDNTLKNEMQ